MDLLKRGRERSVFLFEDGSLFQQLALRLFQVGWVSQTRKEWAHPSVQSPFNRIYFVAGGDPIVASPEIKSKSAGACKLRPGRAYLIPLNRSFDYTCLSRVDKFYAHFRLETALGRDAFDGVEKPVDLGGFDPGLAPSLRKALKRRSESDQLRIQSLILEALSKGPLPLNRLLSRESQIRKKYASILNMIETGLSAELSVEELAATQGKTPAAFSAGFKRDFGESLKSFLNEKIGLRARDLLARSDKKVREVSAELGFRDEFYFSRFFKKMTGRSPLEYRKSSRMPHQ